MDECPAKTARVDVSSVLDTIRAWQVLGSYLLVTSRYILNIRESLRAES